MSGFACFAFLFGVLCSAQIPRGGGTGKAAAPPPKASTAAPIVPDLPQAQTKARIEGQVFSLAGAPLAGASITLRTATPAPLAAITSTDTTSGEEGKFVFEQVEPGAYSLSARRAGYVAAVVSGGQDSRSQINVTVGPAERKTGIVFRLTPAGRISGRVTNDRGDPVPNPSVNLLLKFRSNGRTELASIFSQPNVAADGTFTIPDLRPDRYYVSAAERTNQVHVTTYYPGVVEPSAALPIDVSSGGEARIEIRLQNPRVVHIRGQLIDPLAKSIADGELMLISTENVTDRDLRPTTHVKDGQFQFDGVLPGSYMLVGYSGSGQSYLSGQERVNIGRADVDEIIVRILPAAAVTGKVTLEGGEPLEARLVNRVSLISADGPSAGTLSGSLGKDGTFAIQGIAPGSYRVQAVIGTKYYVKSMHLGAQDVTREPLQFGPGGGGVLNIIASSKVAGVTGVLRDAESAPVPNGKVTLWSADRVLTVESNHDGSFDFPGLAPGEYKLFGWEYIENGMETIREFRDKFSAKAVALKLDEGGHVVLDVPMIRRDAIQAEAAKLP